MDLELKDKGITTKNQEGNGCTCLNGINGNMHQRLVNNVNNSFKQDRERHKFAPTSETMRAKVLAALNGHS